MNGPSRSWPIIGDADPRGLVVDVTICSPEAWQQFMGRRSSPVVVRAVIDTGAHMSCVNRTVAQQLHLPNNGAIEIKGVRGGHHDGSGELARLSTAQISISQIDGSARTLQVLETAEQGVACLLGLDFLSDYELVVDGRAQRFSLRPLWDEQSG